VKKRDGTLVPFDPGKIESAIQWAAFEGLEGMGPVVVDAEYSGGCLSDTCPF
jgi:hypothetical protein